jgi:hypothetical protein
VVRGPGSGSNPEGYNSDKGRKVWEGGGKTVRGKIYVMMAVKKDVEPAGKGSQQAKNYINVGLCRCCKIIKHKILNIET